MPITTTPSERIGRCTRTRRFLVRFNRPESFVHTRSSAGFTIITSGFEFSVHTGEYGLNVHLWDLRAANPCESHRALNNSATAIQLSVGRDFQWIATANFENEGRLWDLRSDVAPKLAAEVHFDDRVWGSSISSDDRWVAFGSGDKSVKILDLRTPGGPKTLELRGHAGRVLSVAFSPDNSLLVTSGEDRTARVWDPENPREAPVVLRGHDGPVWIVGFSPDSRLLVTRSTDETIMLWHLRFSDLGRIACRTAARQLTDKEAKDIIGDEQAPGPCSEETRPGVVMSHRQ
jgi:WD40 repeat protein